MVLEAPRGRLKRGKHIFKWFFALQQWVWGKFRASVGGGPAERAPLLGTLLGGFPSDLTVWNLTNWTQRSQHGAGERPDLTAQRAVRRPVLQSADEPRVEGLMS